MSKYNLDYFNNLIDNIPIEEYSVSIQEEESRYTKSPYFNRWNRYIEEIDE